MPHIHATRYGYAAFFLPIMDILAERNGRRVFFHPDTWRRMPDDKYGWAIVVSKPPAVVLEAMSTVKPQNPDKKPRKKKIATKGDQ